MDASTHQGWWRETSELTRNCAQRLGRVKRGRTLGPRDPWRIRPHNQGSVEVREGREEFDWFLMPTGLVLLADLILGGSSMMLVPTAVLELASLFLLAMALPRLAWRPPGRDSLWPLVIAAIAIAVPLAQLVPLAPDVWRGLPGRQIVADGYIAAGMPYPWLPISLAPNETWAALFKLMPPLAIFCSTLALRDGARRVLVKLLLMAALGSILLAMVQKVGGEGRVFFGLFSLGGADGSTGLFANRNHQGLMLAASVPLVALLTMSGRAIRVDLALRLAVGAGLVFVLVVGAMVTTSRAALVLVVLGGLFATGIALDQGTVERGDRARRLPIAALGVSLAIAVGLVLTFGLGPIAARFQGGLGSDLRIELFPIIARAGLAFAPLGSGLGSFPAVYQMLETPGMVRPAFINHAHNEYLELWLEMGFAGLALIAAFLAWWGRTALATRSWSFGPERSTALAGIAVIGLILIHSAVDYPARAPAVAALFGLGCGFLVRPAARTSQAGGSLARARMQRVGAACILVWPVLALAGWLCLSRSASAYFDAADPTQAVRLNARNPQAWAALAERDFGMSAKDPAIRAHVVEESRRILTLAPLDPRPLRILALLAENGGKAGQARVLMQAASSRSLRDDLVQVWLFSDALQRRDYQGALTRADVVLRQTWSLESVLFPPILETLADANARVAVISALADGPGWRGSFLRSLSSAPGDPAPTRQIFAGLRNSRRPPTEDEVGILAGRMVDRGLFKEARWEWARSPGLDPPQAAKPIYDGDFRGRPGSPPFNWRFSTSSESFAEITILDDGTGVLAVGAPGVGATNLAEQVLVLSPGEYVFRGEVRKTADDDSGRYSWQLICLSGSGETMVDVLIDQPGEAWRPFGAEFLVPQGCEAQMLRLRGLAHSGPPRSQAYFRNLDIHLRRHDDNRAPGPATDR